MSRAPGNIAFAEMFSRGLRIHSLEFDTLGPACVINVPAEEWGRAAQLAAQAGLRLVSLWADEYGDDFTVHTMLETRGDYVVLRAGIPVAGARLASYAPLFPGANRLERHTRDMYGIEFIDHPDSRRWTRHQAWAADHYPLRVDFPATGIKVKRTPADVDYPFEEIRGSGVYEIPVGPVHAGIIEPGHFRFKAVGEEVLRLEERLGYVHKGIEKIAVGRNALSLARLAARVSGDSTVAHSWAACQAMERAAGVEPPPRALLLRAVMAERERIANHLGDLGAICNDVSFAFAHMQCARLRENWQRRSAELFGHRFMMDVIIPGGVVRDLDKNDINILLADHRLLRQATIALFDIIDDQPSLEDRLAGTGRLSVEDARALGCTGYVGKASGQRFDVRSDCPYAPYDRFGVSISTLTDGDVAARVQVRMDEIITSLDLMDRMFADMPAGDIAVDYPQPPPDAQGIGIIDGWRGEIVTYVRFSEHGTVRRFFPRDPSWFTWPALERLIHGNIVPDFPVCNKSVNGSYSGQDV